MSGRKRRRGKEVEIGTGIETETETEKGEATGSETGTGTEKEKGTETIGIVIMEEIIVIETDAATETVRGIGIIDPPRTETIVLPHIIRLQRQEMSNSTSLDYHHHHHQDLLPLFHPRRSSRNNRTIIPRMDQIEANTNNPSNPVHGSTVPNLHPSLLLPPLPHEVAPEEDLAVRRNTKDHWIDEQSRKGEGGEKRRERGRRRRGQEGRRRRGGGRGRVSLLEREVSHTTFSITHSD